jgi:hypothetical protein
MRTITWSLRIKPDERPSVAQLLSIVSKREGGQPTVPSSPIAGGNSHVPPASPSGRNGVPPLSVAASPSGRNGVPPPSVAASPSGRNGVPPPSVAASPFSRNAPLAPSPTAASPSSFGVPPPLHPRSPEKDKLQNGSSGDNNNNNNNNNIGGLVFELNAASGRYAVTGVVQDSPADKSGQASVGNTNDDENFADEGTRRIRVDLHGSALSKSKHLNYVM